MSEEKILQLLISAIEEVAPNRSKEIQNINLDLAISDLYMNSVETMEMVGYIEEQIGATFPDEDLAQITKLGDLATMIKAAA